MFAKSVKIMHRLIDFSSSCTSSRIVALFGQALKKSVKKYVIQKCAVRHITNLVPREHTSVVFKSLTLLKSKDIIKVNIVTFTSRFLNNLLHSYFSLILLFIIP